jgi:hypothetical protein
MNQIFGEFIEEFPQEHDSLELNFTISSLPIKQRWRNNRLAAYFIADYLSNLLPTDEEDSQRESRLEASKNAVSYVGNELLENAIKSSEEGKQYQVKFGIHLLESPNKSTAVIFTKNSMNIQKVEKFQAFIQELLAANLNELYVQQIEETSEDSEHSEVSGIGLLTIINDYSVKLGWKFELEPSDTQIVNVTTTAQIVV